MQNLFINIREATDKDLPTGDGYQYVVLCEKDGCAPVYSEMNVGSPKITPIN